MKRCRPIAKQVATPDQGLGQHKIGKAPAATALARLQSIGSSEPD